MQFVQIVKQGKEDKVDELTKIYHETTREAAKWYDSFLNEQEEINQNNI